MGNQPSASAPKTQTTSEAPLVCDLKCQKEKDLALLKAKLDSAEETKDTDPDGYSKARIAYYTLLNGQGWLQTEKQNIARNEVQPITQDIRRIYDSLKSEKQSQSMFASFMNASKADQESNAFLKKELNKEKDKADVLDRMNELGAGNAPTSAGIYQYVPILIDILIVLLALAVVYVAYTKFFVSKPVLNLSVPNITT
jgi:hypothetical protein